MRYARAAVFSAGVKTLLIAKASFCLLMPAFQFVKNLHGGFKIIKARVVG